jgi:hypothetical protein
LVATDLRKTSTSISASTRRDLHPQLGRATKLVRGLLCFNCNGALGQFRDRTDLMLRAVAYLGGDAVPEWAEPSLTYLVGDFSDPRPPDEPRAA